MARTLNEPWLSAFMKYMSTGEAPENFAWWAGVSALGTVLKNNIFFKRKFITIFPNQYIILIGPPGSGKGSAMNPVINLLSDAGVTWTIRDKISAEKIIARLDVGNTLPSLNKNAATFSLKKDSCMTLIETELALLLDTSPWMLTGLCKMWDDNVFEYDTKHCGTYSVKDVCVSLLGGCVPQYIQGMSKNKHMEAVSGGFSARCVFPFVREARATTSADFWHSPASGIDKKALELKLVADLKHINTLLKGEYTFTNEAAQYFADQMAAVSADKFASEVLTNFRVRLWAHVGKAALCVAASARDEPVIHLSDVTEACERVREVHDNLEVAFRFASESPLTEGTIKIMDYIEANGAASFKAILRAFHKSITSEDVTRILYTLEAIEFVFRKQQGGQQIYTHNRAFDAAASQQGKKNKAFSATNGV